MENLSNNNIKSNIGIDYITFVIKSTDINTIKRILCNSSTLLEEHFNFVNGRLFAGCFGGYKFNDTNSITINAHQGDLGVIVDFKGQAFKYISESEMSRFYKNLRANDFDFSISRIDLAFDDFTGKIIPVNRILKECNNLIQPPKNWVRSVSTNYNPASIKIFKHSWDGKAVHNVRCGSQKSRVSFRMYDKACERKLHDVKWTRLELEIRHKMADSVALSLFGDINLSIQDVYVSLLKKSFRIVSRFSNENNITHCPTAKFYEKFLSEIVSNTHSYYTF